MRKVRGSSLRSNDQEVRLDSNQLDVYLTIVSHGAERKSGKKRRTTKRTRVSNYALQHHFQFEMGIRFELFYALELIAEKNSRIHQEWKSRALEKLPPRFHKGMKAFGSWSRLWPIVADLPWDVSISPGFEALLEQIERLSPEEFQRRILLGALHDSNVVERIIDSPQTLRKAISKLPVTKREWLEHIGLYPLEDDSPGKIALSFICESPDEAKKQVLTIVREFWTHVFEATWEGLRSEMERSRAEKERLFSSCTLEEFAKNVLLRVEFDEAKQEIRAIRGGYKLPFSRLKSAFILPSVFNDGRYWSAYEDRNGDVSAFFPYFDPTITLDATLPENVQLEPQLDVALLFKALGEPTRFAMATLIAQSPRSSSELASILELSKPTISHHVYFLREAGLIHETHRQGSVLLSLRRDRIELLSKLAVARFFGDEKRRKT